MSNDLALEYPMQRTAVMSPCGLYRYSLTRRWSDNGRTMVVIGLNPSTADAETDDQTIRRCVHFARANDHGSLIMVNRYAYRCTDPFHLHNAKEPVGEMNRAAVTAAMCAGDTVVAAWGSTECPPPRTVQPLNIARMARDYGIVLKCFGTTFDGSPRHPSRLPNATRLEVWTPPR